VLRKKRMISQTRYLFVAMVLFLLGLSGIFLNRKNIIILLMSIELMLLSINFNFIIFSVFLDDILGQLFALLVLTVAAAESAIGLAILVIYYRVRGTIAIEFINLMKG
jgi:NADH-quinone oxidoreductase subunit K